MVPCKVSCCPFDFIYSLIWCRLAPSLDPLLSIKFYERTKEQQASLGFLVESSPEEEPERQVDRDALAEENNVNVVQREPHGSVGALAGRRAIAQGKAEDVAAALCRYSAPEEVKFCCLIDTRFSFKVTCNLSFILIVSFFSQVDTLPSTCGACAAGCVTRFYSTSILLLVHHDILHVPFLLC